MASSNSMNYKFDKLSNDNYRAWEFRMQALLREKGVWRQVSETMPVEIDEEERAEWNELSQKALSTITLCCESNQFVHLRSAADAREAWEALKSHHRQITLGTTTRLMGKLWNTKLEVGGSMRAHLDQIAAWIDELSEAGKTLDNKDVFGILLTSLNYQYASVVTVLESWNPEVVTIQSIKSKLLDEWEKIKENKSNESDGSLIVRRDLFEHDYGAHAQNQNQQRYLQSQGNVAVGTPVRGSYGNGNRTQEGGSLIQPWNQAAQAGGYYPGSVHSRIDYRQPSGQRGNVHSRLDYQYQRDNQASRDGFRCHCCGEPGHFRSNCPMRKRLINSGSNNKVYNCNDSGNKNEEGSAKVARFSQWYTANFINNCWNNEYCVDSGASSHMCSKRESFTKIDLNFTSSIVVGNGERMKAKGIGTIKLTINTDKGGMEVMLSEALWVPELCDNLISVPKLTKNGRVVEFRHDGCYLVEGNLRARIATLQGGLYRMTTLEESMAAVEEKEQFCIHEWHNKLAHRNLADIKAMTRQGLQIEPCDHSDDCEACIKGKLSRKSFPKQATPMESTLDCIVSDICGPMQVESMGRKRYFITFTDVYSKYTEVFGLREKGDAIEASINYIESLKTQFGRKPKIFRTDRGTEYLNGTLQSYLLKEGIKSQCTVGYAPEQNGIAERKNRTLMEAARSMIAESGLPKNLWGEALGTANYVYNRTTSRTHEQSPYELFYGKKPAEVKFQEFGCDAYVMIPTEKRRKLDDKAVKMRFVGYDQQAKGYRLIDVFGKIHVSREVKFLSKSKEESNTVIFDCTPHTSPTPIEEEFYDAEDGNENPEEATKEAPIEEEKVEEEAVAPRRSERSNAGQPPVRYKDYQLYMADGTREPKTQREAVNSPESNQWMEAMSEELNSIEENQTWELTDLPPGRKAIGSKWVFKVKRDESGKTIRYKARLVAQGFSQKYGVDYNEVFAPVARSSTFRLLLSVAGTRNYNVNQYDIKTAFLNGTLDEEIYMRQPPGFQQGNKVLKLKKSLYGLKQSARVWNQTLHEALESNGCQQNETDKCLYVKRSAEKVCFILIHVDDLLVADNDAKFASDLMTNIGKRFEIKNLGGVKHYLGIDIERANGKFFISQRNYIDSIVEEARQVNSVISKYPLDTNYRKKPEGSLLPSNNEYRKLIGMLLYLTTNTRPDIAASVSILSQQVEAPRENDLNEVRRVIRYLKGTRNLRLQLNDGNGKEDLHAFSDASWAESKDRRSQSGIYCSANGGTVSWSSRKQDIVSLSSMEAEYIALTDTCKEIIWLRELAKAFQMKISDPITILTDSQSCMALVRNQNFSHKSKHIETRCHFIRDQAIQGKINLKYVPTQDNIADMMTKALGSVKTESLRTLGGLVIR